MVSLAQVVAQVESDGNQWAFRFEPTVWQGLKGDDDHGPGGMSHLILDFEARHRCSPDSARVLLASSWGAFQIMGFNLSGLGWTGTIWEFLASQTGQQAAFEAFCRKAGVGEGELVDASWLKDFGQAQSFAGKYNGPGNVAAYAAKLQEALTGLGG